ncbi:unnamed protein product, partial [marine sediment metagenome]
SPFYFWPFWSTIVAGTLTVFVYLSSKESKVKQLKDLYDAISEKQEEGLIGCGDIANLNVLGYLHSPKTELVSVADINIKNAAEKLERWGLRSLKVYSDYRKMVDHEDLDIVEILTPHHLHGTMTEYCARAGISGISVQKPLAHTITDCEKIIQVCKEENVILKLYENFRFYPVYVKAKKLLEQGIIGEPLNFRINTIRTGGPSMPLDIKALIVYFLEIFYI